MVRKLKKPTQNSNDIISRAKQMQEDMIKVQDSLKDEIFNYQVAGGMITVTMNAQKKVLGLKISQELINEAHLENDSSEIQELLVSAINGALEKAESISEEKMNTITGGIGIPGLF